VKQWREFMFGLCLFAASFLANEGRVSAQTQTYFYTGPAWDVSQCVSGLGYTAPPCIDGSVTGSDGFL
jgi:hypothetical protein